MLKRTTGRLLLALLVTTGLAGTLNNSSLSQKERKQAIALIKSSRTEVLNSISGLSDRQMNYRPSPGEHTIGELITKMIALEKTGCDAIKTRLEMPSNSEDRLSITLTDDQLLATNDYSLYKTGIKENSKETWKNADDALKKFNVMRNNQIKYIRTSTEDLRNRVVFTPVGWIDCYQYHLLLADISNFVAERINKIKASASFPKK
ncbi:MAG TPA: DinB family protein [Chitinophagaceae bacterium]